MTQTKKKSPKSVKKQPISVQLSKDDLKELLVVLKNFILEELQVTIREAVLAELSRQSQRLFLNSSENAKRITSLEIVENNHRREIHKLKQQHCSHVDKLDHISYSERTKVFLAAVYKCEKCGREDRKVWCFLTRKERRALNNLGVTIK